MVNTPRRCFMLSVVAAGSMLASAQAGAQAGAPATAAAKLEETDPQAVALGYKADATKVDKAKYPQRQATQLCSNCNFFQGKAADVTAPCQLFSGKQVAGKGWCMTWVKKVG